MICAMVTDSWPFSIVAYGRGDMIDYVKMYDLRCRQCEASWERKQRVWEFLLRLHWSFSEGTSSLRDKAVVY